MAKGDKITVATATQLNTGLATKADSVNVYTKNDTINLVDNKIEVAAQKTISPVVASIIFGG